MRSPDPTVCMLKLRPYQEPPAGFEVILHGSENMVLERIDSIPRRELEYLHKRATAAKALIARADGIRASQMTELPNILQEAIERLAAAESRMAKIEEMNARLEAKIRQNELQIQHQNIDDAIAALQGPDTHTPTGDLHVLSAKDAEIPYPSLRRPQDEDEPPGGELGGASDPVVDPAELAHPYVPRFRTPALRRHTHAYGSRPVVAMAVRGIDGGGACG
jgi:hypothetical protein